MMRTQRQQCFLDGPAGKLEAIIDLPEGGSTAAVLCHPHPLYGGSMDNKVVTTLARVFHVLGWASIRFNFRGVGKSDGAYGEGKGEIEDAIAVVEGARKLGLDVQGLAGFSFGGAVAASALGRLPFAVRVGVLVAPAVTRFPVVDQHRFPSPLVVAQGMRDEVVDPRSVRSWFEAIETPRYWVELAEAGHFFHGDLVALKQALLDTLLPLVSGLDPTADI